MNIIQGVGCEDNGGEAQCGECPPGTAGDGTSCPPIGELGHRQVGNSSSSIRAYTVIQKILVL